MPLPKEIIDNSEGNKLVDFLNNVLKENKNSNLDIATAFFNINAYAMLKENLKDIPKFRLLLGKTPEFETEKTLGALILRIKSPT